MCGGVVRWSRTMDAKIKDYGLNQDLMQLLEKYLQHLDSNNRVYPVLIQ